MDIKIPYNNCTNAEEAYEIVKKTITPELMAKFKVNPEFEYFDREIIAKGKGFTFTMKFSDSEVQGSLDLGFLLKAFRGQVLGALEKQIKRIV